MVRVQGIREMGVGRLLGIKPEKVLSGRITRRSVLQHPAIVLSPPQKPRLLFFLSTATGSVLLGSETCSGLGGETVRSIEKAVSALLIPIWDGSYRKIEKTAMIVCAVVFAVAHKGSGIKV